MRLCDEKVKEKANIISTLVYCSFNSSGKYRGDSGSPLDQNSIDRPWVGNPESELDNPLEQTGRADFPWARSMKTESAINRKGLAGEIGVSVRTEKSENFNDLGLGS